MTWHKLTTGPHTGKTLPEVMLQEPDYVLDRLEAGQFDGALLAEATEVCRRAARIRVPRGDDQEQEVLVAYYLLLNRSFGGFTIVAKSDPRLADFKRFSAAQSQGFDLNWLKAV